MNKKKFAKIAESLRQYRRADLSEFETELGQSPVEKLYVDPLPDDGVLNSVLSGNTTFVLGRKGTGKSTIFARAQNDIRKQKDLFSVYIDVKSVYDLTAEKGVVDIAEKHGLDSGVVAAHLIRKSFISQITGDLLGELGKSIERLSFFERWSSRKRSLEQLKSELSKLQDEMKANGLEQDELPVLQKISRKYKTRTQSEHTTTGGGSAKLAVSAEGAEIGGSASIEDVDRALNDNELYSEYSDVVFKSLPFQRILLDVQELLVGAGMRRLVVFFDDFSELRLVDQKLFVDVVLSPLNNSSNDKIKLKVAGYPGRVYYGKIDPSKMDTIELDFSSLFEAVDVQSMERDAINYAQRLLQARFQAFGEKMEDYFEGDVTAHLRIIFQATFNVPRLMGTLLHLCYIDRISKGLKITSQSIRLAAQKYYENTVSQYFDLLSRFALEPFENKLDRNNQKGLLDAIVSEARRVRREIQAGSIGGVYFEKLGSNPPTSHFIVSKNTESVFASLESNFLVTRYKNIRDKNAKPVVVFALNLGLVEVERMNWGYPEGREYRNYFVQRCFDYTATVQAYLSGKQTIRCAKCGQSYGMDKRETFEFYKWRCPECGDGLCRVVDIRADFESEVAAVQEDLRLEEVELRVLEILNSEDRRMAASEISTLLDVTYQLVGRRTNKLRNLNYVEKEVDEADNRNKSQITPRAKGIYFDTKRKDQPDVGADGAGADN
jgi:hypothetical protein